eukprot:Clim_evm6s216 gene=Clim_evmTU6s216
MFYALWRMIFGGVSEKHLTNAGEKCRDGPMRDGEMDGLVVIVGAGFSGMCMAIKLKQRGVPFIILEKESGLGGTWYKNTYPGCQCDVPSVLYSYSFEQKADWTETFARQKEILEYQQHCAEKYGILPYMRFNKTVVGAHYDDDTCRWTIHCADGSNYVGKYAVRATGGLDEPAYPEVPGRETFAGPTFHSARWNHDVDLTNKRVAVIGNAASAIQFVPIIAKQVQHLTVFQRTPQWITVRPERQYTSVERFLFRYLPGFLSLYRLGSYLFNEMLFRIIWVKGSMFAPLVRKEFVHSLTDNVRSKEMQKQLRPDYPPGCKRLLMSNDFYRTLNQDNVDLVTDAMTEFKPTGITTADGTHHEFDVIIYATGFNLMATIQTEVKGKGGRDLETMVGEEPHTFLGIMIHGFPNTFGILGPNTGLGHNSIIYMIECQVNWALEVMSCTEKLGASEVDVKDEVVEQWMNKIGGQFKGKVWNDCKSWYLNSKGFPYALYPNHTFQYYLESLEGVTADHFNFEYNDKPKAA